MANSFFDLQGMVQASRYPEKSLPLAAQQ